MSSAVFLPELSRRRSTKCVAVLRHGPDDVQFRHQLGFTTWFSQHITALEKFGGTCAYPENKGLKGVTCNRKRRVLHTARPHAPNVFREMLECAME